MDPATSARHTPDRLTSLESDVSAAAPSLQGRRVALRPLEPEDYPALRRVEIASDMGPRWRFRGATPSPEEWAQSTAGGMLAQFLVVEHHRQDALGIVAAYQPSFQDGYATLAAARFDRRGASPLFMLGLAIFLDYVFACWDLRKLYMEVAAFNYEQFASGEDRLFRMEGRLQDHTFFNGQHWDHLILAIYRDTWHEQGRGLVRVARGT